MPFGAGGPDDADVRRRLKSDRAAAVRTLQATGIRKLAGRGSCSIRFRPVVPGDVSVRVGAGGTRVASGRRRFSKAGSYRVTLKATRAGRRYLRANPAARWKLKLGFAPAATP